MRYSSIEEDRGSKQQEVRSQQQLMQYTSLHLSEVENEIIAMEKKSAFTIAAMRKGDSRIQDDIKKRRGRKKFIMSDESAKLRLNKRTKKIAEKQASQKHAQVILKEI